MTDRFSTPAGDIPLRPVHLTPGRLRLKAGPLSNGTGPCWALRDALEARDGVTQVAYRPTTQSFIIRFDPEQWDTATLPGIAAANGFAYDEEPPPPAPAPASASAETATAPKQKALALVDPQSLLMMAFLWSWIRSVIRGTAGFNEWLIIALSLVSLFQHWQRKLERLSAEPQPE